MILKTVYALLTSFILLCCATQPLLAQYISVEDIHFPAGTAHQQLNDHRIVMSYSQKPGKAQAVLRTFLFDTLLSVHHNFQLNLPYAFQVLKVSKAGDYYAHLLLPKGATAKQAMVVVTDNQGNITGQFELTGKWKGIYKMYLETTRLIGASHEPAFYLMFKKDKDFYSLVKLMYDGTIAWEHSSESIMKTAPAFYAQNDYLYIFEMDYPSKKRYQEHLIVLGADDGKEHMRIKPGTEGEMIKTNRLNFSSTGDTLTFIGRSYAGAKLDSKNAGWLYLARYDKGGNLLEEQRIANNHERVYWHDLVEANGRLYMVGETFRTTSFGEHMLIGMATGLMTLGTFYISTASLTTKDLVIQPLDGATSEQRVLSLPSSKFTIGTHLTPFVFADSYADRAFRYRSCQNGELLLQVKSEAYRLNLAAANPEVPQAFGLLAPQDYLVYSSNRYFIAFTVSKAKNTYRLQRYKIQYPAEDATTKTSRL